MKQLWQKRQEVAKLIRLDKQYGTLLLLFPTLWSLFVASEGRPSLKHLAVFVLGSFMMRSAGCVMNDMADRKFDARVERTKDRPLAKNALTLMEALVVLFQLFCKEICQLGHAVDKRQHDHQQRHHHGDERDPQPGRLAEKLGRQEGKQEVHEVRCR